MRRATVHGCLQYSNLQCDAATATGTTTTTTGTVVVTAGVCPSTPRNPNGCSDVDVCATDAACTAGTKCCPGQCGGRVCTCECTLCAIEHASLVPDTSTTGGGVIVAGCANIQCLANTACQVVNNVPTCVAVTAGAVTCANLQCPTTSGAFVCQLVNNVPTCVATTQTPIVSTSCTNVICPTSPVNMVCQVLNTVATCVFGE